ncbi:MAG: Elongation factor P-(R)-beta-lysine ligase [Candidatus Uhrbacteria bacterium GW2011_GWA2_52_8d]|uniref:Elongation factor P-(R)-beta-lysine ligase n=1 Tax=Candidatus Uhrbacteria bacterium GW2011_GWA2_52_8d TaxID=1618979 RepID=A0A0G2AGS9_9BACT|nr:MAG: Elongation factor P-(R)-beta-lysine ligase [Candidatus Uhrbacteria bacterium GW2011_GWA2_52_8d]
MWQDVETKIHAFFQARGFVHVRTPLVVRCPGMEPNLDPLEVSVNGEPHALITSPEYSMKKLVGAGLEKIYTMTPVFRNNETGNQNAPEFTMLEWYAPGTYEDLMNETYPKEQASLARLADDGTYAERFEAFGDGMELCNGFCELLDPVEQRARFVQEQEARRQLGKTVSPIDEELLEALGRIKGSLYGNALGLDRLVMLKYAIANIHDIQLIDPYGITKRY